MKRERTVLFHFNILNMLQSLRKTHRLEEEEYESIIEYAMIKTLDQVFNDMEGVYYRDTNIWSLNYYSLLPSTEWVSEIVDNFIEEYSHPLIRQFQIIKEQNYLKQVVIIKDIIIKNNHLSMIISFI